MTIRDFSRLALLAIAFIALACTEEGPRLVDPEPVFQASFSQAEFFAPPGSIDAVFLEVNGDVPGFAGMIIEDGKPVLLLVEGSRAEQARAALHARLPDRSLSAGEVTWRQAQYEWREMVRWHAAVLPMLTRQEVVFSDADEALNRVVLGVVEGADEEAVLEEAVRRGVPREAVVVTTTERPVPLQTLEDRIRPTRGGLRINHEGPGWCTMGFNVNWAGIRTFMTNSHCTEVVGELDGRPFYQPTWNAAADSVGVEYLDPSLRDFGAFCPSGRDDCRWSDAALVAYSGGVDWQKGAIARTTSPDRWNGSRTLEGTFWIGGKYNPPVVGQTLHKMGATTGWTYGDVDAVCVNYPGPPYLMCQDLVNAGAWDGDSGSPVFLWVGGDDVELAGILWGGHPRGTAPGARFVFSRIGAIEEDFGASLDVVGAPPSSFSVSIIGPDEVQEHVYCMWSSSVSGGAGGYSYEWRRDGQFVSGLPWYETIDAGDSGFLLELYVSDAGNGTGFDYLEVRVQGAGQIVCE